MDRDFLIDQMVLRNQQETATKNEARHGETRRDRKRGDRQSMAENGLRAAVFFFSILLFLLLHFIGPNADVDDSINDHTVVNG